MGLLLVSPSLLPGSSAVLEITTPSPYPTKFLQFLRYYTKSVIPSPRYLTLLGTTNIDALMYAKDESRI
jgi:hypothetical protein